eukprot:TRINITY_DN3514_c3_g1_i2.p1 TRINITY_DN3514_c3_g1~~TRINITY_DN3514_c3_g1_i2.p1  ORF type:complete len:508 (+),score=163.11 TRINITY_DN3514_c3_g1_i2:11-1534(+)
MIRWTVRRTSEDDIAYNPSNIRMSVEREIAFKEIQEKVQLLADHRKEWLKVTFKERSAILDQIVNNCQRVQTKWVKLASEAKKVTETTEELNNVWIIIRLCRQLQYTFEEAIKAQEKDKPIQFTPPPKVMQVDGQYRVIVQDPSSVTLPGIQAEVWIHPGKPLQQGGLLMETFQQEEPLISLVLGAGNQSSISMSDALYKLFNENQVVIFKHNPVLDYFYDIMEEVFQPLIQRNVFHHVKGGADEGAFLCHLDQIDTIHMTGSEKVFNLIHWGSPKPDPETQTPQTKPITSELGCVTPWIFAGGDWSDADLKYHANNLAGCIAQNCSFNCVAPKVLVFPKDWEHKEKFWTLLQEHMNDLPLRFAYYPGATDRFATFCQKYPQTKLIREKDTHDLYLPWAMIDDVPTNNKTEYCFSNEAFCPIITSVSIENSGIPDFLEKATKFCNEKLWGNLSCTILVHPAVQKIYDREVETAVKNLKYGCVGNFQVENQVEEFQVEKIKLEEGFIV